ncbi:hypothetical protein L1987_54810 [Smallanthus sonchifolius]|uniref:Uncharacterized protein n=1 Tax=Smallanthus sonchifolius TaxID=185202 RepID=A0ACB9E891_9ASTR|nr:hypothetical protein L1987_54810 [Smallanthus sonchifolius]
MDIFNKKSMFFLFALTLLVCSSYADDHLPQPRLGDPELANLIRLPSGIISFLERLRGYKQGIKIGVKTGKAVDRLAGECAEKLNCAPASKVCGKAYCVYRFTVSSNKYAGCQKFCGTAVENCYYNSARVLTCK